MELIILAGMPASGKSVFAQKLSRATGYPVLEKDAIKEQLFDVLGFQNYAQKRRMDVAATAVLLTVAETLLQSGQSAIVVNNFRDDAQPALQALLSRYRCGLAIVFFGGDCDVFYQRYVQRDNRHERHLGHVLQDRYPPLPGDPLEYTMTREEFAEKFERLGMDRLHVDGGARIDVDATDPASIDTDALIRDIRAALSRAAAPSET